MNESMDHVLADWLQEGPESGPREGLERSLEATRRVGQRPGWTLPERWIPMGWTMSRTREQLPILVIVMLAFAGLIEVYVSPTAAPAAVKVAVGLGSGAIVLCYVLFADRLLRLRVPQRKRFLSSM